MLCRLCGSTGVNGPSTPLLTEATQKQPQHNKLLLRCTTHQCNHWRLGLGLGLGLDQRLVVCPAPALALALASDCVGGYAVFALVQLSSVLAHLVRLLQLVWVCCKHNKVYKRMVWLTIACNLLRKDKLSGHDATRTLYQLKQ